jgi:hypothetical protein
MAVTVRDGLALPIHSPSALGAGGAASPPPPLPPHAANASIAEMAKALIAVIVLAFIVAPCDYCGGLAKLVASFRGNAKNSSIASASAPLTALGKYV